MGFIESTAQTKNEKNEEDSKLNLGALVSKIITL